MLALDWQEDGGDLLPLEMTGAVVGTRRGPMGPKAVGVRRPGSASVDMSTTQIQTLLHPRESV